MVGPAPTTATQLLAHLNAAATSTPYAIAVLENRFGRVEFTIELDLKSERWRSSYEECGLDRTFRIRVRVIEPGQRLETSVQLSSLSRQPDPLTGRQLLVAADPIGPRPYEPFGSNGRILEFGEKSDRTHSFTAIEAVGWLRRESEMRGFTPRSPRQ